jgi:hypothetical protein
MLMIDWSVKREARDTEESTLVLVS